MKNIEFVGKWNLANGCWEKPSSFEDAQKSLAVVSLKEIINSESLGFDYIIVADGTRVENHFNNGSNMLISGSVKNVVDYFSKRNSNFRFKLILLDNDAPLKEDGKWIASYLDFLAQKIDTRSISYIGISKCGVMAYDLIKYLRFPKTLRKLHVFSVSSPYRGTIFASPLYLEQELRKILEAKIGSKTLQELIYQSTMALFRKISSNSHMDYDIALPGGAKELYDPTFIADIFSTENALAAQKVKNYQNLCTFIDEVVRKEVFRKGNFLGIGLCLLDRYFFRGGSDGLVPLSSQKHSKSDIMLSSFHNPLETVSYAPKVLDIVWDSVNEEKNVLRR